MDELRSRLKDMRRAGAARRTRPAHRTEETRRIGAAAWTRCGILALLVALVPLLASLAAWHSRPAPLANTADSPEALAASVLDALRAGDVARLEALALTEEEFRAHVWPELPAARPERNVPCDFVWTRLRQNSDAHLRRTLAGTANLDAELRGVTFTGLSSEYGDVTVHRDTTFRIVDDQGTEKFVRLFGSTIEQDGRYKVFSYVVD